ncbi:DUF2267 domain-containing protein [Salinarimonas sp. NSM]|uniref:DUF2267 domain-containing protein n=1 Tax=Salinarimonas sp. NSM TaxID=3458003 RepID=UPI0040363E69
MSATELDVIDRTVHATHVWLDEITAELGPDRRVAWHVLGAVLHAVRDRLPIELAVHFAAQMPLLVRGLYYDRWHVRRDPEPVRNAAAFLEHVGAGLSTIRPVDRVEACRAVFGVVNRRVTLGQIENVRDALPSEVRALWPGLDGRDAAR